MIIKEADDKKPQIEALQALLARPDVPPEIQKRIEQEIRNIRAGAKGEAEAAYEMGFHYGESKNWAIIHDIRLEIDGRVAQIDHLVISRILEVYVCESKHFSEGLAINEHGEFTGFYTGKPYGVSSPIEQNRKHIAVLEDAIKFFQGGGSTEATENGIFPKTFNCPICSKRLKASRAGRFRCSECKTILAIDNSGQVFLG